MDLAKCKISNFKLKLTNFVSIDREGILTVTYKVFSSTMLFKSGSLRTPRIHYILLLPMKSLIYIFRLTPKVFSPLKCKEL